MSKYLLSELLLKLFALAVGLGVTLLLLRGDFAGDSGKLTVVLGLLSTIVTTLFIEFIRLSKKFDDQQKREEQIFAALAERFSSDAQLAELLRAPQQELSQQQVPDKWLELLWRLEHDYAATNYISRAAHLDKGYASLALDIQALKVKVKYVQIHKVFIVDDATELRDIRDLLLAQCRAGVQVRTLQRKEIDANAELKLKAAALQSIDFALVNHDVVLLWFLDGDRRITHGKLLFGEQQYQPYKLFFDSLYREAKPFVP